MLTTAAELVLTGGLGEFSIDEVARRSGVAKTTIYRHFPTRNDLLIEALDAATPMPEVPDTGTLRGDLEVFLTNILPIFRDDVLRTATLELFAAATRDPDLHQIHATLIEGRLESMNTIVGRARERGEIPDDLDDGAVFEVIEGPFIVRSLLRPEALRDVDLEALVDRMIRMLNA